MQKVLLGLILMFAISAEGKEWYLPFTVSGKKLLVTTNAPPTPPAPWTPAEISTVLWFDAADASTITEAAGLVSQWDDKSGNNYDATQGSDSLKPETGLRTINGTNVLDFVNDNLGLSVTETNAQFSICLIFSADSLATFGAFLNSDSYPEGATHTQTEGTDHINNAVSGRVPEEVLSGTVATNTAYMYISTDDNTNVVGWLNGNGNTTNSITLPVDKIIGDANIGSWSAIRRYDGVIGEIIVLDETGTTNRQLIEGYLAWKWGLQGSLPSGHPYKSARPVL